MTQEQEIQYARNGDHHIAYNVRGRGEGVDVLCIRSFVSNLEVFSRFPPAATLQDRLLGSDD